jgi:hypothetical protein
VKNIYNVRNIFLKKSVVGADFENQRKHPDCHFVHVNNIT